MKRPAISLIIPAFNEEKRIYRTLVSVSKASQFFKDHSDQEVEIILVDNNSDDRTVEIAKMFNVKIEHEEKHVIAAVRNKGAKVAEGNILCFLDADSEISESIFYNIYLAMESGKYIGGGVRMRLDKDGFLYNMISLGTSIISRISGMSAVLIYTSKETFERLGGFNEEYYAGEDLKFVMALKKEAKKSNKLFKNIYDDYVITSARKFNAMSLKDIFVQVALLLNNNFMKKPQYCYIWYSMDKRGE